MANHRDPGKDQVIVERPLTVFLNPSTDRVERKEINVDHAHLTWWHVRRWAEQAWTAVHGPRR
jgi:hypothetical protein